MTAALRAVGRAFAISTLALAIVWEVVLTAGRGQEAAPTLRTFLVKYGFDDAITAASAPDVDRPLGGWGVSILPEAFVAAYYDKSSASPAQPGPLHVIRFERKPARWVQTEINDQRGGSIDSVQSGDQYVIPEKGTSGTYEIVRTIALLLTIPITIYTLTTIFGN